MTSLPKIHDLLEDPIPADLAECAITLGRCFARAERLFSSISASNAAMQTAEIERILLQTDIVLRQANKIQCRLIKEAKRGTSVDEVLQSESLTADTDQRFKFIVALKLLLAPESLRPRYQELWNSFSRNTDLMDELRIRDEELRNNERPRSDLIIDELGPLEISARQQLSILQTRQLLRSPHELFSLGKVVESLTLSEVPSSESSSDAKSIPAALDRELLGIDDEGHLRDQVIANFERQSLEADFADWSSIWRAVAISEVLMWIKKLLASSSFGGALSLLGEIVRLKLEEIRVVKITQDHLARLEALTPMIDQPSPDLWVHPEDVHRYDLETTTGETLRKQRYARVSRHLKTSAFGIDSQRRFFRTYGYQKFKYFKPSFERQWKDIVAHGEGWRYDEWTDELLANSPPR